MLCLEIAAPEYLVIELIVVLFKELYSLCVGKILFMGAYFFKTGELQ